MSIAIIPKPELCKPNGERFRLSPDTQISVSRPGTVPIAETLQNRLRASTGFPFALENLRKPGNIHLDLDPDLGKSAYRLECTAQGVDIVGGDPAGLFHGTQTLLQLCPPDVLRQAPAAGVEWFIDGASIEDRPRFGWRGFLLDTSRHFFGKAEVLKLIDALALHRMNVLHMHLTDDQGWRIEIPKFPRLTQVGAWRAGSRLSEAGPNDPDEATDSPSDYGGYFTQSDLREIVAYAAARFITVVPEIDVPGHSQAAIAAYAWLGNTEKQLDVWTKWSVNRHVLNVEDRTLDFYRDVLDEVMEIFPGQFIHIGGDECLKDEWIASSAAQTRMRSLHLKDEDELQAWFIKQLGQHITSRGRRMIGWDEIMQGGLPEGAAVMSWQGEQQGVVAASAGHDVVMAPEAYTYLYRVQGSDPVIDGPGVEPPLDLQTVFEYDVIPPGLPDESSDRILGAQCQMWTEFVQTSREMEKMVFPRLCAFSEAVWSSERVPFTDFVTRMRSHSERLQALDLDYHRSSVGQDA